MKKLFTLPALLLAGLALSSASVSVPAMATEPVASVESVTADSTATLLPDMVQITTTPAPDLPTTQPTTEPAPATTAPTQPATAPAEPTATVEPTQPATAPATEAPTAPVTEAAETYPAPLPTATCMEDMPCWDCKTMGNGICGNPVCIEGNQFTVDAAGTCSRAPIGWTDQQVMAEGQRMQDERGRSYLGSGSYALDSMFGEGYNYVESPTIPGVWHVFA